MPLELILTSIFVLFTFGAVGKKFFFAPGKFTLVDFHVAMAGLYVGVGLILSYVFGFQGYKRPAQVSITIFAACMLYCCGLLITQRLLLPVFLKKRPKKETIPFSFQGIFLIMDHVKLRYFFAMYAVVWGLRYYDIMAGQFFSGTGSLERNLEKSYAIIVLNFLIRAFSFVAVIYSSWSIFTRKRWWFLSALVLLAESLIYFSAGRRSMVNFVLYLGLPVLFSFRKKIFLYLVFAGVTGYFMFNILFPVFLSYRGTVRNEQKAGDESVLATLQEARLVANEKGMDELSEGLRNNLQSRTRSNYGWILQVVEQMEGRSSMKGEVTFSAMMSALPRVVRPSRYWHLNATVIQDHLGIARIDTSDNHIATGYVDFRLFGCFLMGVLVSTVLTTFSYYVVGICRTHPAWGLLCFAHLMSLSISFETSATAIFSTIRSLLLIFVIVKLIRLLHPVHPKDLPSPSNSYRPAGPQSQGYGPA